MEQVDVQLWNPVYCFHTPGTLRYIWIGFTGTPHVALVYTHSEVTLCRTIDHRGSLAIALVVQFLKTFKLCFIYSFFFQNYWGGDRRPCRPFADALVSFCNPINDSYSWILVTLSNWTVALQ